MKTAKKQGAGKKPKNRDELIANILSKLEGITKFVKMGMPITDSCRAAGVNPRTYYSWIEKSETMPEYEQVNDRIEEARAIGQAALVNKIIKRTDDDWRAAAWILERRHRETWGKPTDVNVTGGLDVKLGQMTDAEVEAQLAAAEAEMKQLGEP